MPKKTVNNITPLPETKNFPDPVREGREVIHYGIAAVGQAHLLKSLRSERLSASQAIKAKCYDCMGYYEDGKGDCQGPLCPLYPWMPYGTRKGKNLVPACTNRAMPGKKSDGRGVSYPQKLGNVDNEAEERS